MSVIFDWLIDFVYPKRCINCDKYGEFLCRECLKEMEYCEQICPECGEESIMGWTHEICKKKYGLDGLISVFEYKDECVRKVIDEIKFGFNRELVKLVIDSCDFEFGEKFDYVAPVPLYYYRENWRGFNQSERIAKAISSQVNVGLLKCVVRVKNTKQQSLVKDKKERHENVKEAFKMIDSFCVEGKNVLVVDDVYTSGASMKEVVGVLKKAGAKTVWGFSLAH